MITNGYINILWYQHIEQGINSMISEKNKLPNVAIDAVIKDKNTKFDVEFKIIPIKILKNYIRKYRYFRLDFEFFL